MTIAEKLAEALRKKENDINSFEWMEKDGKTKKYYKMIDASPEQIQKWADTCKSLLYSTDKKHLGRAVLLENYKKSLDACRVELFLRYLENTYDRSDRNIYPRHLLLKNITEVFETEKYRNMDDRDELDISTIAKNFPLEFSDLKVGDVKKGCLDALGIFDSSKINYRFLARCGVCFETKDFLELKELDDKGERRPYLQVMKERLNIAPDVIFNINEETGLSYTELKTALSIKPRTRYSSLSTEQLELLRNKLIFVLINEIDAQVKNWRKLQIQLELVANHKEYNINF